MPASESDKRQFYQQFRNSRIAGSAFAMRRPATGGLERCMVCSARENMAVSVEIETESRGLHHGAGDFHLKF